MDITRKQNGKKFSYYLKGKLLTDKEILERIRKLCIPPVWSNVKISSDETSYLQVTGIDVSGRKQYLYHPVWNKLVKIEKYDRIKRFSEKFGTINNHVNKILKSKINLNDKNYLIALIIKILINTHSRIGNDIYAEENNTYGLTTLHKRHVLLESDDTIHFLYKGKHNLKQHLTFRDKLCCDIIRSLKTIPGERLFKTRSNEIIRSTDINQYLKNITGDEFTCKDFRTYSSNNLFLKNLNSMGIPETKTQAKKNITLCYRETAKILGHTENISRTSYVMPMIKEKYLEDPETFINNKNKVHDLI